MNSHAYTHTKAHHNTFKYTSSHATAHRSGAVGLRPFLALGLLFFVCVGVVRGIGDLIARFARSVFSEGGF